MGTQCVGYKDKFRLTVVGTLTEFLMCEMALGMVVVPALPCEY